LRRHAAGVESIKNAQWPSTALHADALAAHKPIFLIFATPRFCATAQCGPTLDRLKPVAAANIKVSEMKVPEPRSPEVQQLIVTINEQLWIGHFDVWMQSGMVMFRHALLLVGGGGLSGQQCEAMFGSALDTCERYYPAFQFVIWAGKSAREAMDAVMFETCGEA
jgi:hypothetical protein